MFSAIYWISRRNQQALAEQDLAYWKHSGKAKDFLLARAHIQNLLPAVRFNIDHNGFGILRIYSEPGEEPKKVECMLGEDGNIYEIPLK